jgi:hypothetical protein
MEPQVYRSITTAYRHLYRTTLKAVRYSTPARYSARDVLRRAFRETPNQGYDPQRIANTVNFLDRAAKYAGFEHRILKNMLFIRWWRDQPAKRSNKV